MGGLSEIGGIVNDILGGTTSASKANKYALRQQAAQNSYNKEVMQNLHQWEVADLKAAGLNPALSYGGNTSGIATGTASGPQAATADPIQMIATAFDVGKKIKEMDLTSAQKRKTDAENDLIEAQTANQIAENPYIGETRKAQISNINANTKFTNERSRGHTKTESKSFGTSYLGVSHNTAKMTSTTE